MNDSPYNPPNSNVFNETSAYPRKRNVWIWLIIVYQAWAILGMIFTFVIMRGGLIPIPKELHKYYDNLGLFDWIMTFVSFTLILLTIIFLFRLSKLAVRFFVAEFALSALMYIVNFFKNHLLSTYNHFSWLSVVIGYLLMFLILFYLLKLQKRGVLQ